MSRRKGFPRQPARLFLEELENRVVPSAISWTGNAGTLNWGDATNWSGNAVPGSADDVTISINVSGTINIGTGSFAARSLNDSTASLAIASGGSLSLAAGATNSTFGRGLTVSGGGTLAVGAGATVNIGGGQTLSDNGTVTLASGDTLTFDYSSNVTEQVIVGSGGLLTAASTAFNNQSFNNGNQSVIEVTGGGHLQASNSTFNLSRISLDSGSVLNAGDLVNNAFNLPLYLPATEVQYLSGTGSNNQSFQAVNILGSTLAAGQSLALNAIGTATTANLSYIFPNGFTVASGASVTVAPNVSVQLGYGQTLSDNGTVTLVSGDTLTFDYASNVTEQVIVGSGGLLTAASTVFNNQSFNNGNQSVIEVTGGGHMQASNSSFNLSRISLDSGSVLNAGDLVNNAFNLPLYLPANEVQYLSGTGSNNQSFQAVNILGSTLAAGQSLALNAIGTATTANLSYIFPNGFTVASGASVTVAPNVSVQLGYGQTLSDNGTVTLVSGDTLTFDYASNVTEQVIVGSGGLLTAASTVFNNQSFNNGNQSVIEVTGGGHLQASNSSFNLSRLSLDSGIVLNVGDLVNNAFNLPLYLPATEVQYLSGTGSNNQNFQTINILGGTLTAGQTLALNAIGTASTANLTYIFPNGFTVASGASVTVAPNVSVQLGYGQTLSDNGTVSLVSGDTLTFDYASNVTEQVIIGSGGLLTAASTVFNNQSFNNGNQSVIEVTGGGHLQASNSSFNLNRLSLDSGSVLNVGDLVNNAFNLSLYLPATEVQYLSGTGSNNQSFEAINILGGTLSAGQSLALNAIGTATTANLSYYFPNGFTVASGAMMMAGPNVSVHIPGAQTLSVNGMATFVSGDTLTFDYASNVTEQFNIGSGGVVMANATVFNNQSFNNGNISVINVYSGGNLQASNSYFGLSGLGLSSGANATLSLDVVGNSLGINSAAIINIANNDFSNLGTNALVAGGDPNGQINLVNNYWGTTVSAQIAAKILDHVKDATRPTVNYTPFLTTSPVKSPPSLAFINDQTVNEGSTDTFTASATDPNGDTLTYSLDPGAPTGASVNPSTGVFSYQPADGPATYTVKVRVTENGPPSLSAAQAFTVHVLNVAPTASLAGPTDGFMGIRGQTRTFIAGATDPSHVDQAAGFTYDLNWGDGSADTIVSGLTGTQVTHVFLAAGNFTVTATATDKDGGLSAPVTLSVPIIVAEVQNGVLMIGGTPDNDTFALTPGINTNDMAVTVNGTSLGTFSTNGQVQVFGFGGSGDILDLNDQGDTQTDQYLITASTVGRTNAATITDTGVETINVTAGTKANTIDVQSTAAGTSVAIAMGNGGDIINVGSASNTLDGIQGALTVIGGTGSNTLNVNDQGSSAAQTYTVAATTVGRSGSAGVTYSKMKQLTLNGSSAADTIIIVNTSATTPVTVLGGGGMTTLVGPNATNKWILGGANGGTVGNVTFSGVSNLVGGSGNDTFTVAAAGSLTGTINGGAGKNNLNYSTYGGAVTIDLQTGAATATGGMRNIGSFTGSNSLANKLIGANTPNTWSITGVNAGKVGALSFTAFANLTGGIDVDVFKLSNGQFISGVIDGGGGGDWLDYAAYSTNITVNLTTGVATGVNGGILNIQNVRAGSGGSTLTGNALGNILVGGAGADTIIGGSGRSVLIGGAGNDSVTGGSGNDIIIGGNTTFDNNNAALTSILADCQRTYETYRQRINNLKNGGGLNGRNKLIFGTTVLDDGGTDTLTGAAGGMDWYFMGANDTITDLMTGEQVN